MYRIERQYEALSFSQKNLALEQEELENLVKKTTNTLENEIHDLRLKSMPVAKEENHSLKEIGYHELSKFEQGKIISLGLSFQEMIESANFQTLPDICCSDPTFGKNLSQNLDEYIQKESTFWKNKKKMVRDYNACKKYTSNENYYYVLYMTLAYSDLRNKGDHGFKSYVIFMNDQITDFKVIHILDTINK